MKKNSWWAKKSRALGKSSSFCLSSEQIGKHCFLKIKGGYQDNEQQSTLTGLHPPFLWLITHGREGKTGHSKENWHWWYLKFNWTCRNLPKYSVVSGGVISFCSNRVKYTTFLPSVTGSCETAFRFVICLYSLCLGKGTSEGLKDQVC